MKVKISDSCTWQFSYLRKGVEYEVEEVIEHEGEEYYMIVDEDEDCEGDSSPYLSVGFEVVEE